MKVGCLCYATEQGLGILAKSFYDHGVITDFMIVRHDSHETQDHWYPRALHTPAKDMNLPLIHQFIRSVDVMLFFETPFNWDLLAYCREVGVKSVLMPMYECAPAKLPIQPDLVICPSLLDQRYYPGSAFIPVPVEVPWRLRTRALKYVHHAGHMGLRGRNGTKLLISAMPYVASPITITIRTQEPLEVRHPLRRKLRIEKGTIPYADLWIDNDVFVFPEKFNGLSLPLQEARAAGMLVMGTDRFPMNTWLPTEPLIPVTEYTRERIGGCNEFDSAVIDQKALAAKIDEWYDRDITAYSESGREWASTMTWDKLKPQYMEALAL